MIRLAVGLMALVGILAGCGAGSGGYTIRDRQVQENMLDGVNALRAPSGLAPLVTDEALISAAMRHAKDMSVQARPWNWGSDGSSPIQRVVQAGYNGVFLSELIAETFESETDTLAAWFSNPVYRDAILDSRATRMGLGYHQDSNGKIWWAMELGAEPADVLTAGISGT